MKPILKTILLPVTVLVSCFVWLCTGLISCSTFVFTLAGSVLGLLAFVIMLSSVQKGLTLLALALLVSPLGIPLLSVKLLRDLQSVNGRLKDYLHS